MPLILLSLFNNLSCKIAKKTTFLPVDCGFQNRTILSTEWHTCVLLLHALISTNYLGYDGKCAHSSANKYDIQNVSISAQSQMKHTLHSNSFSLYSCHCANICIDCNRTNALSNKFNISKSSNKAAVRTHIGYM